MSVGCNKLKGDRGDKGDPGPGRVYIITGPLSSNSQTVAHRDIRLPANIAVYLKDGIGFEAELPYYLPGLGMNAYALISEANVIIYNGLLAGANSFEIVVVTQ